MRGSVGVKPQQITTALDIIALTLIILGVWLIYIPAALIVAGVGLAVASWRKAEEDARQVSR